MVRVTGAGIKAAGLPSGAAPPWLMWWQVPNRTGAWRPTAWLTRQSRSNQSLHQNSLLTGKLTGNFAVLGVVLQIWHPINAKLQSVAVKFPKQKNREFFEASREITKLNRDQPAAVRHHVRNSLWPSTLTRFSLEGEELGSNILQVARRTPANCSETQGMHLHYDRER